MQRYLLVAGTILVAVTFMLPATAAASRYEHDGYKDRHYKKHQRHYRSHKNSRRYDNHYRHRNYDRYTPGYIRYRGWPVSFHIDLSDRHHRDSEVVIIERDVASADIESAPSQLFIYPRNGQSVDQRDQDRYECHLWSRDQTDYDPSQSSSDHTLAPDYNRAMSACLEGRGYTVK